MSSKQPQNMTADEFADFATRIYAIAEAYARVAASMRERGIREISVIGVETLEKVTLTRINGPLQSAERALLNTKATTSKTTSYKVAEDPAKFDVQRKASRANKTSADRKNKKA